MTDQQEGTWMDKLTQIKAARSDFDRIEKLLDPDEHKTISENIRADAKRNYDRIYQAVKAQLDQAIIECRTATGETAAARAREINSWDQKALYEQQIVFKIRIHNEHSKPSAVGELYREAQASGDRCKMRAAAEVLQAIDTDLLPDEDRLPMRLMAKAANDRLNELRTNEEIKAAIEKERAAAKKVMTLVRFAKDAGKILYEDTDNPYSGDFSKLIMSIYVKECEYRFYQLDTPGTSRININKGGEA